MNVSRPLRLSAAMTALLSVFVITGSAAPRNAAAPQTDWRVLFDLSPSVKEQIPAWLDALSIVTPHAGDTVRLYAIGDRTADWAPLFDTAIPGGTGMTAELKTRRAIADAARGMRAAADRALQAGSRRSSTTRLIEGLGRVTSTPGREMRVLIYSDALEDSDLAKFETNVIADPSSLATRLAERARLAEGAWSGAKVVFVLDSPPPGRTRPQNDRVTLRAFYNGLVQYLGGNIVRFDSAMSAWPSDPEPARSR